MPQKLTDLLLRQTKVPDMGRTEISDTERRGLRVRVYAPSTVFPKGKFVWLYEKRVKGGKKRKHTLGMWPTMGLGEARSIALEIEAEAAKGIDRVSERKTKRLEDEAAIAGLTTVERVIEIYYQLHLSNLRTGDEIHRAIKKALNRHLSKSVKDLTRKDLQEAIDNKVKEGRRVYANRIRAMLLAFSRWAWQRSYLDTHVGDGIPRATKEAPRDRVLSIKEVQHIWETTYLMGNLWGPMLRLIILTGQRRGDIASLRFSEIDLEKATITKSGAYTKNGQPHKTHLAKPTLEEIQDLSSPSSEYLFSTTGKTPVSGFSKMKKRLDELLGEDFEPWTLHDLRTAMATALAEIGIPETIVDRIQNHQATGSAPSAVSRVYNQAEQLPQRAKALGKWADMVTGKRAQILNLQEVINV